VSLKLSWKTFINSFLLCTTSAILLQKDLRWVMGHCVLVYLINSGTWNFVATTIFRIRHFFVGWTGLYKSTPSIAMILTSSVAILSWSMPSDDLVLQDLLENAFTIAGVGVGVVACTEAGLCWGSWPCSSILSSSWAVVAIWKKVMDWLEGPSLEAFLSVCSIKLVRRVTLAFRDSNSS